MSKKTAANSSSTGTSSGSPAKSADRPAKPDAKIVAEPKPVAKPAAVPVAASTKPAGKPPAKSSTRTGGKPEPAAEATRGEIANYSAAVRWLLERTDFERMRVVKYTEDTFKLDRMRKLLSLLGNPHEQFRSVHVAGTNGKGSTTAMIAAMLQGCGYATGLYTSPHLVDLRERIQVNGVPIERNDFTDLMKEVAKAAAKLDSEPTFFEIITALGFKHFAEQAIDIAVVEVGLGGRLDSTNVIRPEVSIITSIDFDHTKLLGNTLPEIAREKAGIFKKDVPALIFESEPSVEKAIREVADQVGAPLRIVNKDIEFSSRFCSTDDLGPHTRVCLYTKTSRLEHLPVPLPGEHQASNCGLALAAIDVLRTAGLDCPEEKVTAGLARTVIPGRMQVVWDRPRVVVDGAHNPGAMTALMRCIGAHVPYDSMICVFGCCADKDVATLLDKVNLGADKVIFTRAQSNARSADPEELQRLFMERSGKMSQIGRTLPEALELASRTVGREDLILVTGSFYLVGETMKHLSALDRAKGGRITAAVPTA